MRNPVTRRASWLRILPTVLLLAWPLPAAAVDIDWVMIEGGDDLPDTNGLGAVVQTYRVSRTEVTNAQYAEFLNAIAREDTFQVWSPSMTSGLGGIRRFGSFGNASYATIDGRENMPVNFVSYFDALRFANWLHNGQPTGAQDATTTEDGAYTFIDSTTVSERNAGAGVFLPSEDEWYKAAYYDAALGAYHDYPNGSSSAVCSHSTAIRGASNCYNHVGDLTNAGAYTLSPSPNGTFDQGGNASEWTEGLTPPLRTVRGGNLYSYPASLSSSNRSDYFGDYQESNVGFRIAAVPEPGTGMLSMTALIVLAHLASRVRRAPTQPELPIPPPVLGRAV